MQTNEEETSDEITVEDRKRALGKYLEMDTEEKDEDGQTEADRDIDESRHSETTLEVGKREYLVLTDEEADEETANCIKQSLWAFNANFIIAHSKLPYDAIEMVKGYQTEKCEGANDTIEALIEDMDDFVKDAISADGRAHFLNTYDGNENEETITTQGGKEVTFYIYRTN